MAKNMSHRLTDQESEFKWVASLLVLISSQKNRKNVWFEVFFPPESDSVMSVAVRACSYRMSSNVNDPLVLRPTSRCFHQQRRETTSVRVAGARVGVMRAWKTHRAARPRSDGSKGPSSGSLPVFLWDACAARETVGASLDVHTQINVSKFTLVVWY